MERDSENAFPRSPDPEREAVTTSIYKSQTRFLPTSGVVVPSANVIFKLSIKNNKLSNNSSAEFWRFPSIIDHKEGA